GRRAARSTGAGAGRVLTRAAHRATPKWTSGKSSSSLSERSASITSMTVLYSMPGFAVIVTCVSSLNAGLAFFRRLAQAVRPFRSYSSPALGTVMPEPASWQPVAMLPPDVLSETPWLVIQAERLSALDETSARTRLPPIDGGVVSMLPTNE